MSNTSHHRVQPDEQGQRLDNYLIRLLKGVPKSHIYRIIRSGEIRVNKGRAKAYTRINSGDLIRIPPIRLSESHEVKVNKSTQTKLLNHIIHEDKKLIVMNKPANIAVHGGSGQSFGIIEALRQCRDDLPYLELIHRLDKETSGCLLIAKKRSALKSIQAALTAREVQKTYWAIGSHRWHGMDTAEVTAPLQKNTLRSGERMVIAHPQGKASKTHFRLLENYHNACWLEASPVTGRTHQIRVHSAQLSHIIMGDEKYGFKNSIPGIKAERLYLHAREIQFTLDDKSYHFKAEVDALFASALERLKKGV